ncbi:MAG: histone deacetylase family protein, partial [Dongiaceae bacterium]
MRTVYSEDHRHQDANLELIEGKLVKAHEMPRRADIVLDRLKEQQLGEIIAPQQAGLDPILRVHDA